jgi:O-acetyl-ADP-ribose deacetylase (regulator of RNase III)
MAFAKSKSTVAIIVIAGTAVLGCLIGLIIWLATRSSDADTNKNDENERERENTSVIPGLSKEDAEAVQALLNKEKAVQYTIDFGRLKDVEDNADAPANVKQSARQLINDTLDQQINDTLTAFADDPIPVKQQRLTDAIELTKKFGDSAKVGVDLSKPAKGLEQELLEARLEKAVQAKDQAAADKALKALVVVEPGHALRGKTAVQLIEEAQMSPQKRQAIDKVWEEAHKVIETDPFGPTTNLEAAIKALYDQKLIDFSDVLCGQSASYVVERAALQAMHSIPELPSESEWQNGRRLFQWFETTKGFKPAHKYLQNEFDYASWQDYLRNNVGKRFALKHSLMTEEEVGDILPLLQQIAGADNPYMGKTADQVISDLYPKLNISCGVKSDMLFDVTGWLLDASEVPTDADLLAILSSGPVPDFVNGIPEEYCFRHPFKLGNTPQETLDRLKDYLADRIESVYDREIMKLVQCTPPLQDAELQTKLQAILDWKQAVWPAGKPLKNKFLAKVVDAETARNYCGWDQSATGITDNGKSKSIREMIEDGLRFVYAGPVDKAKLDGALAETDLTAHGKVLMSTGSITKFRVDAISNAANEPCTGGGGIDAVIHGVLGPAFVQAITAQLPEQQPGVRCPTGTALPVLLPDTGLNASSPAHPNALDYVKVVLQAVGPVYNDSQWQKCSEKLASAYRDGLEHAHKLNLKSVVFPGISTAIFGFNPEKAEPIAMRTVRQWLEDHPQSSLQFVFMNYFHDPAHDHSAQFRAAYRKFILDL